MSYRMNGKRQYGASDKIKPNVKSLANDKIRAIEKTEETKWVTGIDRGTPTILREHKKTDVTQTK